MDKSEDDLFLLVEDELKESYGSNNNSQPTSFIKPFKFKMDEIEGFRYRARDVLRSITTVGVKEARLKEIKLELLNSEKLRSYFEENPREEQVLRHDKELNSTKLDDHLKNVPDYIIPPSLRGIQVKREPKKKSDHHGKKRLATGKFKFSVRKFKKFKLNSKIFLIFLILF